LRTSLHPEFDYIRSHALHKELGAIEQYRMGLDVELEHGKVDQYTNVTNDNPIMTGKIALAHLNEFPDYYTRLDKMEKEAKGKL